MEPMIILMKKRKEKKNQNQNQKEIILPIPYHKNVGIIYMIVLHLKQRIEQTYDKGEEPLNLNLFFKKKKLKFY